MNNKPTKIRLANSVHTTAIPFNLLRGLDFIEYQEDLISRNAQQLNEHEIDLGLIPCTEYALSGNYVGLDYGVACHKRSDLVMLYAKQDLRKIQTVYYHQRCGSTPLLLKLILKSRWKVFPRMIKAMNHMDPEDLGPNEALLVIHEKHVDRKKITLPVAEDLIKLWYDWVGLPFVFLIWSTRPGVLSAEQFSQINEVFNICDQVRECELETLSTKHDLPFGYLSKYQPDRDFYYRLGELELKGLNTFFQLCAEEGLLPYAKYNSSKLSLLTRVEAQLPQKADSEIYKQVLDGQRISIVDATVLAETSAIEDLGMVADSLRGRLYSDFSMRLACQINSKSPNEVMEFVQLQQQADLPYSRIELIGIDKKNLDLRALQKDLALIKNNINIEVATLTPSLVVALAKKLKLELPELCAELAVSGVDVLGSDCAPFNCQNNKNHTSILEHEQWSNLIQMAHKFGLKTDLQVTLSPLQSWEQRILQFQKIRFLQDLSGSIQSFSVNLAQLQTLDFNLEDQLRYVALARVYLDNIATIRLIADDLNLVNVASFFNFGCNAVLYSRRFKSSDTDWRLDDFKDSLAIAGLRLNIAM